MIPSDATDKDAVEQLVASDAPLTIKEMREEERPREKATAQGIHTLSTSELLAIQLGTGIRGLNVVQLAQKLLSDVEGNLFKLYQRLRDGDRLDVKGIGPAKRIQILSALELGKRMEKDRQEWEESKVALTNSQLIYNYIYNDLYALQHEEVWLLMLDVRCQLIHKVRIAEGGLTAAVADVRVIMKHAIANSCHSIALVHNHPSGDPTPSGDDDRVTKQLLLACEVLNIRMNDHLIFTSNRERYYSYHDEGRLDQIRRSVPSNVLG